MLKTKTFIFFARPNAPPLNSTPFVGEQMRSFFAKNYI